ncbi:MAG: AAA family ATPase [Spirochaetales bacterium]|nr:AAA family ATPase [Spirochaetales bacterium]MCF7938972.1 AAA family ATPase [Spirochaetales bacterium]
MKKSRDRFVNRTRELSILEKEFRTARVIVLYGRRRIGKTRLLKKWGESAHLLYTQAIEASESLQLQQIYEDLKEHFTVDIEPRSWFDMLKLFSSISKQSAIVLDEFPYLVESSPSLPSILQRWIDHDQADTVALVLSGSSTGMMHSLFLDTASPLYGRADRILRLEPMGYPSFTAYMQDDPENRENFIKYSVTGGVPKYWEYVEPQQSAAGFIDSIFSSEYSWFENEPYRILKDEKINGIRPVSILEALGRGASKPSEIAKRLQTKQTDIGRPLLALLDASLISRELPFGESVRSTKKTLYSITDHTLRFWYSLYSPHRSRWHLYSEETKRQIVHNHAAVALEKEYRALFSDAERYWEGKEVEFDCLRHADESMKRIIVSAIKWKELNNKTRTRLKKELQEKYADSGLAKKYEKADFEILDFHDVVRKLQNSSAQA